MDASISAPPPAEAPAIRIAHAAVDVGAVTTYYRRAGSGEPVLLLSAGGAGNGAGAALFDPLSRHFRVFAPEPVIESGSEALALAGDAGEPAFSRWLRDFLDGLGVLQASIVAEERFGLPALSFALSDPDRVEGLVLLFHDAADPTLAPATLPDGHRQSGHPLLVLRTGREGELPDSSTVPELVEQVLRFLREAAG